MGVAHADRRNQALNLSEVLIRQPEQVHHRIRKNENLLFIDPLFLAGITCDANAIR